MDDKRRLRDELRARRRAHFAGLAEGTRALLFMRPPNPMASRVPEGSLVGLYHALPPEAPTGGYARWFFENGRHIALPWFAARGARMRFRRWAEPYDDAGLEVGPYGALQPLTSAEEVTPDAVFVPLLGFTAAGDRLGQGGGHYDRWLAAHADIPAFGLAWDCQLVESLPLEAHDRPLAAVITPTRLYERLD